MLKFIKGLVQTPEQKAAEEMRRLREGRARGPAPAPAARMTAPQAAYKAAEAALDTLDKRAARKAEPPPSAKTVSPERAALMRQALEVRKAKQKIFDDLNDEDRARLIAMAILAFARQGKD